MEARSGKGAISIKRLVREGKNALDTPALISLLAQDQDLLQAALRVLNSVPGDDAGFLEAFDRACRQENLTAVDLKRRLAPAAAALGLANERVDESAVLYDILDVPSDASNSIIRKAYRSKAREWHPDANPDADPVQFVRLTEAYRVLSNPGLRKEYDARQRRNSHWEERSHAFREEAQRNGSLRRRHKRRMVLQGMGALVFLLVTIGFADQYFKEQSLLVPIESKAPDPVPDGPVPEGKGLSPSPDESGQVVAPHLETGQEESSLKPAHGKDQPLESVVLKTKPTDNETARPAEPEGAAVRIRPEIPDSAKRPLVAALTLGEPAAMEKAPERLGVAGEDERTAQGVTPEPEAGEVQTGTEMPATEEAPSVAALTPEGPAAMETAPEKPGITGVDHEAEQVAEPEVDPLKRIEGFISSYCEAYEALSYERFMGHFTLDALENDRTVKELRPQYRTNFDQLQSVSYDIEVEHYTMNNNGMFEVRGDYVLRWRFKGADWRERRGPIFLVLVAGDGSGLRVKSLVYQ